MTRLLIFATLPPPIGGVTTHIKRLLEYLDSKGFEYTFLDLKRSRKSKMMGVLLSSKYIHFHTSNPYIRLGLVIWGFCLFKKMIFTYHGNLGQYTGWKNFIDRLAIGMAFVPVMLNEKSFNAAYRINKKAVLIPAFIPPVTNESLSDEILEKVFAMGNSYKRVYATNAHTVALDRNGSEIYQITALVKLFKDTLESALVISDPSGSYKRYFEEKKIKLSDNILIISEPHSFYEILKRVDALLRITTTDGDSLSVKEALYLNTLVIATDVVNRPPGVVLVKNMEGLKGLILNPEKSTEHITFQLENGAEKLLDFYKSIH